MKNIFSPNYLDYKIYKDPTELRKSDIKPNERLAIWQADDKKYIQDQSMGLFSDLFFACILFVAGILFYFLDAPVVNIILGSIFILWGLYYAINGIIAKQKLIIFDRENQTVTYPSFLTGKPITVEFTDLKFAISSTGYKAISRTCLVLCRKRGAVIEIGFVGDLLADWSFFVWYMDKNRELPPGTAFNKYRKKDDERRKNEGHPKPLFPMEYPLKYNKK